jgi:hypothetical protein
MLNLKTRYGAKYRIAKEQGTEANDPAGWLIPCKYGHLYAHSAELLGVATNGRGIVRRLLTVDGLRVVQDGSDGVNATFPPEAFAAVAKIMRPRTKRKLSPEHKAKLLAASRPFMAKAASKVAETTLGIAPMVLAV